jgi:hypothetical protein
MLPNLLIIGAMKCGTSSLYSYMKRIPGIFMSDPKELNFFTKEEEFAKGIGWYASQFPDACRIRGEASTDYSKGHYFPGAVDRIASIVPDAKLIYLVRNPVERALSHYLHHVAKGWDRRSVTDALSISDDNDYLLTGRYIFQLAPFREHFPEDQILVLVAEDLDCKRLETVNAALEFLGVDTATSEAMFTDRSHQTRSKIRYTSLGRLLRAVKPGKRVMQYVPLRQTIRRWLTRQLPEVQLDADLRKALVDYYREDVRQLEQSTGLSLSSWFD